MAKLYLKFEQSVLKEFNLARGVITIGRLPDNLVQIDDLAVSGHHARICWEADHYLVEDNNSLNGTYVNNHRVTKAVLKDDDQLLIGKHTLMFKDEWHEDLPSDRTWEFEKTRPLAPTPEAAVMLDTEKAREMIAPAPTVGAAAGAAPAPVNDNVAVLTVMDGKTDQPQYVLSGKLNVIGKSEMASIKLKGWFAPKVAAVISHREHTYFIAASEKGIKVKVNEAQISGQHELHESDLVEVAGVKMTFNFAE